MVGIENRSLNPPTSPRRDHSPTQPQFELSPDDIGKGGLVKHPAAAASRVEQRVRDACDACGVEVSQWFESPIAGGDGNQEFFVWGQAR